MGHALVRAARDAGLRITLLDTCYLAGGLEATPLEGVQRRFGDGDARGVGRPGRGAALGVRRRGRRRRRSGGALGAGRARRPARDDRRLGGRRDAPLHVHLSEQRARERRVPRPLRRDPTRAARTTTALLGPRTSAVHATHLTDDDIALLGGTGTAVCLCPTTERDLADGIGPRSAAARRRCRPVTLGSDSHAVIDLFEEARAVELDERLATEARGHFAGADAAGGRDRRARVASAVPDAGALAPGAPADLVAVRLDSVRTAGGVPATALDTRRVRAAPRTSPTSSSAGAASSRVASTCCSATSAARSATPSRRWADDPGGGAGAHRTVRGVVHTDS